MNAPYCLGSLGEMLKKYASIFTQTMIGLHDLEVSTYIRAADPKLDEEGKKKKRAINDDTADGLRYYLNAADDMATDLSLDAAAALIQRMRGRLKDGNYLAETANKDLENLRERIEDQLASRQFLFVPQARVGMYDAPALMGVKVSDRFPDAIPDIVDAGKCLALGLGTLTVLHLMRVTEVGLKELAKALGIPYAPSWESYLRQIADTMAIPYKKKPAKWRKVEPFFRDISGDLVTVKNAFRNPTMHVVRVYTAEEAEQVLNAVRQLMARLADGLPPSGTPARAPRIRKGP